MSLAFIFGTNLLNYDPRGVAEFHAANPVMQRVYERVGEWTGLDEDLLLRRREDDDPDPEARSRHGSVALAAAMVGIHDVLGEQGIHPGAVGGLSLGSMVSSCLAGVLPRQALFELLMRMDHVGPQDPDGRAEGVAVAFLPVDQEEELLVEPKRDGVWLAGDFGTHPTGTFRILLLSGYREALEQLAAETTVGSVQVQEANTVAVHTPLRAPVRDSIARVTAGVALADPVLPLCSCLEPRTLTTAAEVADMFSRNAVETIRIDAMSGEMRRHKTRLGLVLGPSLPRGWIDFPFPVVHVESPADLPGVMAGIFEHGVVLPPRRVR
ncbi:hypothetical protein GCM10010399_91910 [Dactylosporangium fulvum]|uniref:Malonyl-CoA:ACP transacylase (MAT) domain-containing protein n=1 Tax=Dactylosporangium fulvum TaxID=53359 RepID=A0ABY5VRV3_9ACTN|nr:hypothetical protein [Dactylosporangium fulvum]UWP79213.1 hypothetical protein Dfulv_29065 [Dactylosporangium fulvum]